MTWKRCDLPGITFELLGNDGVYNGWLLVRVIRAVKLLACLFYGVTDVANVNVIFRSRHGLASYQAAGLHSPNF